MNMTEIYFLKIQKQFFFFFLIEFIPQITAGGSILKIMSKK